MKRTLRLGLTIVALVGLIAAAVLLAFRPWSDGPAVQEAVAHPADYGLCNVSVNNLPEGVSAGLHPFTERDQLSEGIRLMVLIAKPEFATLLPEGSSRVVWDAVSGVKVFEYYRTPADEAKLKGVEVRVGPWEPAGQAWPRTDTIPQKRTVMIRKPPGEAIGDDWWMLRYRPPEDGSGLLIEARRGESFMDLRVYTCESLMVIDARTGIVVRDQVAPEEEAMFQRFLDRVVTP